MPHLALLLFRCPFPFVSFGLFDAEVRPVELGTCRLNSLAQCMLQKGKQKRGLVFSASSSGEVDVGAAKLSAENRTKAHVCAITFTYVRTCFNTPDIEYL